MTRFDWNKPSSLQLSHPSHRNINHATVFPLHFHQGTFDPSTVWRKWQVLFGHPSQNRIPYGHIFQNCVFGASDWCYLVFNHCLQIPWLLKQETTGKIKRIYSFFPPNLELHSAETIQQLSFICHLKNAGYLQGMTDYSRSCLGSYIRYRTGFSEVLAALFSYWWWCLFTHTFLSCCSLCTMQ